MVSARAFRSVDQEKVERDADALQGRGGGYDVKQAEFAARAPDGRQQSGSGHGEAYG